MPQKGAKITVPTPVAQNPEYEGQLKELVQLLQTSLTLSEKTSHKEDPVSKAVVAGLEDLEFSVCVRGFDEDT